MGSDDEEAFTAAFERHRHGVHAFLLGRTSDPEAARDLLQETFLRLWRRLDEVSALDEARQRAWLVTVARNLVTDRFRARATREATVAALASGEAGGVADADASEQVAARDQLGRLDAAIARLPADQRVVLSMAVVGDMTSRQIGEALELPAGTVRYRLHRARASLARELDLEG